MLAFVLGSEKIRLMEQKVKIEILSFASSPAKTLQNELCLNRLKLKVNIGSSVNCVFQTALLKNKIIRYKALFSQSLPHLSQLV